MKRRRKQHVSSSKDDLAISQRKKRLKKKNSGPIPIDLIIDILLRLPAKSIARCRCVSKLWGSTLRLPCFTELFLTRSSSRPKLFFSRQRGGSGELVLFSAPQVQNLSLVTTNYHMKFPFNDSYRDAGSFDHLRGLTCLTSIRDLKEGGHETVSVIYNPTTRESLNLPNVMTRNHLVRSLLGYDPIGKQFKVLSMTWIICSKRISVAHHVLTLGKTNRWRRIECFVPHHPMGKSICIDGGLYYNISTNKRSGYAMIVWFDVRSEKFRYIYTVSYDLILVNYKGKLGGLLSGYNDEVKRESKSIELWVLVDAEKHDWSKHVYELPSLWKHIVAEESVLSIVGMIPGTSEIVFVKKYQYSGRFHVYYYDFERETITRVEIQGMTISPRAPPFPRIETFLDHLEDVKLFQMF